MKPWSLLLSELGFPNVKPFTRQENTAIQPFAVACHGVALAGIRFAFASNEWENVSNNRR